ncbi:ChaN family lipoprotein [Desulfohalobiaceae bacterium Ax17]|uniref:ChaN family lipoprotein n=1 Tax=Desulfovulcanus ferrireducens TaxID=2831190 RepID=UPI00207BB753|nr:ChaN family lipoprotein [Desulfovulcanus ferrireducens]MBT8763392.1 ChaN family lipoprotein [Desulfovulcanus ferrireducens]
MGLGTFLNSLTLVILSMALAGCAVKDPVLKADEKPGPGSFLSGNGSILPENKLLVQLKGAQFVLVGEGHRSSCDHKVQLKILKLLTQKGAGPILALEMVSEDKQEILDQFTQARISLQKLPQALKWEDSWGYDFDLYAPIFAWAKKHKLKIIALNLPHNLIRKVAHKGLDSLSPNDKKYLPQKIIPVPKEQKDSLIAQFSLHQNLMQKRKPDLDRFLLIQSIWDSKMAEQALKWQKKLNQPVLILAGSGHVENGWGIEHRLKILDPQAKIVRLEPLRTLKDLPSQNTIYFYCPSPRVAPLGMMIKEDNGRFIIEKVLKPSKAYQAGIKKGDIIVLANEQKITSLFDLHKIAVAAKKKDEPLCLKIKRGDTYLVVEIRLN